MLDYLDIVRRIRYKPFTTVTLASNTLLALPSDFISFHL
jgi:hypothetical protein